MNPSTSILSRRPKPTFEGEEFEIGVHRGTGETRWFRLGTIAGEWAAINRSRIDLAPIRNSRLRALMSGKAVMVCGTAPQLLKVDLAAAKRAGAIIIGVNGAPLAVDPMLFDVLLSMHHQHDSLDRWKWNEAKGAILVTQSDPGYGDDRYMEFQSISHKFSETMPFLIAGGTSVLSAVNLAYIGNARAIWLAGVQMHGPHAYQDVQPGYDYGTGRNGFFQIAAAALKSKKIGFWQTTRDSHVKLPIKAYPGKKSFWNLVSRAT